MKKFIWPLQRLLDIKTKQESAVQAELIGLMEQSTAVRGRILMCKMMLQNRLRELKNTEASQRLEMQRAFMQYVHIEDAKIDALNKELNSLEQKRNQKTEQMMELRKLRKGLERLQAKAQAEYHFEMNREEQKLLDESTHVRFARKSPAYC